MTASVAVPQPPPADPRLTPARPDLAAEHLRGRVEAARFVAGEPRRVIAAATPLRRAPRADAAIDTEAVMGDAVTVYEARDGFAWVQLAQDGYVGYLDAGALGPPDPAPTHRLAALRSFRYPAPDLKRPPLGHLGLGAGVTARDVTGDYLALADGSYLFAGHCEPVGWTAPDPAATASRLLGTPYLWGGRTSLGLDCSGLVQLCFALAGLACPRDADQQERGLGAPLPLDLGALRRNDLVFWRGHVGLMRDATTLIHANGHHMAVAEEPLAEAVARIRAGSYGAVTSLRRPDLP
ncbi:C40 family peptidase [Methylobacterium sp. A54F]